MYQDHKNNIYSKNPRKPLVSVIIPVFNQEVYLKRCLDSILQQEFSEFEIILIDDASTDLTPQVCKNYAEKDARIQVISNRCNMGQGYGRNAGLLQADGEYVVFVDSDDYVENALIIEGVQVLENASHVDVVIFNRKDVDIHGKVVSCQAFGKSQRSGKEVFQDFCMGKLRSYGVVAKMYRKTFLDAHALEFPEYMWEDNLFTLKVYYYSRNIVFTGTYGYTRVYVPHPASAMTPIQLTSRHISGICALVADIHTFFTERTTEVAQIYAQSFEQNFIKRFNTFFPYMITCYHNNINPVSCAHLQDLLKAKFFLSALLENYALLYASRKGFLGTTQGNTPEHSYLSKIHENIRQNKTSITENMFQILAKNIDILEQLIKGHVLLVHEIQKKLQKSLTEQALFIYEKYKGKVLFYKTLQYLLPRCLFKLITNNNFSIVINRYNETGFEAALQFLQKQILPAYILADAYTALAKHIKDYDIYGAMELAFLAYEAEPRGFRLKWFAYRCREAGDVDGAKKIFDRLHNTS